ncbi:beta-galactosidase [Lutibacter citreus]|uniref:beta-galactosidase n=1 Tax=Lutibacter citreus TaxID=2138210 RepID=UPI000DBE34D3|nr:beta-galactosidase [Lutibacter citreus]
MKILNKCLYKSNTTLVVLLLFLIVTNSLYAQLEQTAKSKITDLEVLIEKAEEAGIDASKEKMTIRTAEVFLKYANWDENHLTENTSYFNEVQIYRDNAAKMAADLPDFERNEIVLMLDDATTYLTKLINGELKRKPIPKIDWAKVSIEGNKVVQNGKPVFLDDYTWKPSIPELTEYFGDKDGVFMTPTSVTNANGTIKDNLLNDIQSKTDGGRFGSVFLNHKNVPNWAETKYGPGFKMREDTYTAYDIDNPGALEMQGLLLGGTVPQMANKKYTELGYMLANEPHFITTKDGSKKVWASGPVSEFTKAKFRIWLKTKHTSISDLNALWGKSFSSFNDITIDIPIEISLRGTPMWYDWQRFNMDRVTEWFSFLRSEIQKHDSKAKTHIKLIPKMWSGNARDYGLDFEALMSQSEILGNDAGSHNNYMWGPTEEWESRYNFEWRELAMSYDFFKSISLNKINYNSEGHFLSTTKSRDLYQKKSYARMTYWLAYVQGLNVVQTWYWSRREDGSVRNSSDKGYAGSNNQQPRVVNEVASTLMDLNTFSEDITVLQNLRKPIRIFYSEASALNKTNHMDGIFELYESLYFEGLSLGFATENIIKKQNNSLWDVVLVYNTEFVTESELDGLQEYLNNGGTIILDSESLKKNEYGEPHTKSLNTDNGGVLISGSSFGDISSKALDLMEAKNRLPNVILTESNSLNLKGCTWRSYKNNAGENVVSIVNVGKESASVKLVLKGISNSEITNLITGEKIKSPFIMKPEGVLLLAVSEKKLAVKNFNIEVIGETCPNEKNGNVKISIDGDEEFTADLNGVKKVFTNEVEFEDIAPGSYILCIKSLNSLEQCYKVKVEKASEISGKISFLNHKASVEIIKGTAPFNVQVNGENVLNTSMNNFLIDIKTGDKISVKSNVTCEGSLNEYMIKAFPNPTKSYVEIPLNVEEKLVEVELFNFQSQKLSTKVIKIQNGKIQLNLEHYPTGVYIAKIKLKNEPLITVKILKE